MNSKIDFKKLDKSGAEFESLIRDLIEAMGHKILENPAVGPDGGRDILVERTFPDPLGERRDRVVVQCKHYAHSSRAVTPKDIDGWQDTLAQWGAKVYLLATSTRVTENLNRLFIGYSQLGGENQAIAWDCEKIATLLSRYPNLVDRYFGRVRPARTLDFAEGWGVILPSDFEKSHEYILALEPLLKLRKRQAEAAGGVYKEFTAGAGYRAGEDCNSFLLRHGVGPGNPNPTRVPRFLLLIGDGNNIPFTFQTKLSVQHSVGRLSFDEASEYAQYAQTVTAAEDLPPRKPRVCLFNPEHGGDPAVRRTLEELVVPLSKHITDTNAAREVRVMSGSSCTKEELGLLLGGSADFVFVSAHGVGFVNEDPRQRESSGAIVTSDWPGVGEALKRAHYFTAEDIQKRKDDQRPKIVFLFGCYSAGLREVDEYSFPFNPAGERISPQEFVSALPKKLLGSGVALAVVGHVGRSWTSSFSFGGEVLEPTTFMRMSKDVICGEPIGIAIQSSSRRYAELAASLTEYYEDHLMSPKDDPSTILNIRNAVIASRDYIVLGDPAVRLNVGSEVQ